MKSHLLFNFSIDKEKKTIRVKREFAANLDLVWKAWTTPALLDQWWAPKPYQTKTKSMDFRAGGFWLYAMVSPENEKHWCKADYQAIAHLRSFSALDAFCDANGKVTPDFPRSFWTNTFNENAGTTTVNISIAYDTLADLEKMVKMGFQGGFTMGLKNLDELLENLVKQSGS